MRIKVDRNGEGDKGFTSCKCVGRYRNNLRGQRTLRKEKSKSEDSNRTVYQGGGSIEN